jgi:ubiquinone/menaquinone biosynthesis C-methylase UbiE
VLDRERAGFNVRVLRGLVDDGLLRRDMSVLVSCGGDTDREVLLACGFEDVTITNVDASGEDDRYAPYGWAFQDAEALAAADESYDVALVSAGLHHCHSPHRALLELYRVARVAAVVFEAADSALMRAAVRASLAADYEVSAVAHQSLRAGGVANSEVPNFVYRWTPREVEKTIASYAPHARHRVRYFHDLELPSSLLQLERTSTRGRLVRAAKPFVTGLARVFPSQANLLAFVVEKPRLPEDLQPWMTLVDGRPAPDAAAIGERYRIGGDIDLG